MPSDQSTSTQFTVGQVVIATGHYGWVLTAGKRYTVAEVIPRCPLPHFTFPEYTGVIGDNGQKVFGHNHRFRELTPHELG